MATITKQQAIDRLTQFVEKAQRDDLVEIYSELFPEETAIENEAGQEVFRPGPENPYTY